jgi:hypothetical protein
VVVGGVRKQTRQSAFDGVVYDVPGSEELLKQLVVKPHLLAVQIQQHRAGR